MAASTSLTAGAAGRYATALFELSGEDKSRDQAETDLVALQAALDESDDLDQLIRNPMYTREQQGAAISAVVDKMDLSTMVKNVVGLMATKRRLFALPEMIAGFQALMADERGEISADVTAARELSDAQIKALSKQIKEATGKDVNLNVTVDDSIIGGLVVKVGSRMIDTSIRSRLNNLQNAMKEVG